MRDERVVTDFLADLKKSKRDEEGDVVQAAIRKHFPEHLANHPAHTINDRAGVDRWIELRKRVVGIDVKARTQDFQLHRGLAMDVALELTYGNSPGWAMKATCAHYYLVVCLDSGRSALFHSYALQRVLAKNIETWRRQYPIKATWTADPNGRPVKSTVMFVPAPVLSAACERFMEWEYMMEIDTFGEY